MAYRKGVNKRYPNGTQPLCEAATSTIKSTLFLSDAAYRAAYRQFQEICLAHGIRQKLGVNKVVWQGAVDALIRQNTDINNAINVIPGTPTQLQDRRTVLGTMCRQASKNLRARGEIPAPGPQIAPALSPPPGPQLALDPQHILGHQTVSTLPAGLLHDTNSDNQLAVGITRGFGAPYSPTHYGTGYQQYQRATQHVHLFASSSPPTFQPYPSQAQVQSALVLEDTHAVDKMRNHHEIPIDPVLLAHDASTKQQAANTGAQLRENGVEVSGHGKIDVEMEEEGMEEEL